MRNKKGERENGNQCLFAAEIMVYGLNCMLLTLPIVHNRSVVYNLILINIEPNAIIKHKELIGGATNEEEIR